MKDNLQLEKKDIRLDPDMEVDYYNEHLIIANIETWFDVDKKFMIDTTDDDTFLNMFAKYDPFANSLEIDCVISRFDDMSDFKYNPTKQEADLIKQIISDEIRQRYDMTPQEYCIDTAEQTRKAINMGGI